MESDNNLNISPNSDQNASLQNPVNQELGSLDSKKIIKTGPYFEVIILIANTQVSQICHKID